MTSPQGPMPAPPFPDPQSAVLKLVIDNAINAMRSGEATAEDAILHAAVHGWYEGHIQGEDSCHGCDFRGELSKQEDRDSAVELGRDLGEDLA
ncbi:hypothetical protein JQS43_24485 [Natronosporangium hydrolyticum]|uniref:Uncharacterized protein n=1 Tax=Natronosporangium hydrolyticum TaxID=2811111 RepID=A0A895YB08_9ACTN|nr:hypothetical protein [Natronosporangium hydrolyticum]QSB14591.1 hypothetical protein JQS43_24485 [Natronosporangium hydrolyticum]